MPVRSNSTAARHGRSRIGHSVIDAGPADRPLCVVGLGARTAIGATGPASMAAVLGGVAGFGEEPGLFDRLGAPIVAARAPYLDPSLDGAQRFAELAVPAAIEALEPLTQSMSRGSRLSVVLGLPESRPGLPTQLEDAVSRSLRSALDDLCHVEAFGTLARGHSAGMLGLARARAALSGSAAEFCLVGGVDSYLEPMTLEWLEDCGQLHNGENAWGFVPGEGASFCLVCAEASATRLDLHVLGRLITIASAREPNRIKTRTICLGEGLTAATRDALDQLPGPGSRIDQIACDLNGEAYRTDELGFMLSRAGERFRDISAIRTPADAWGDVGAASAPLLVATGCFAASKGVAKGPLTLLFTGSEGGDRVAAVLHA